MGVQTAPGSYTSDGVAEALAILLGGDPYTGATLHLFQSSFAPSKTNTQADFAANEATFTGYAPAALTYSGIGYDSAGNPTALSDRAFFQATDAVAPNNIGGAWIEHSSGGMTPTLTVVNYFRFPAPVPMANALAFLGVVAAIQAPGGGGYAIVDN